jgi:hypothetical protein
MLQRESEAQKGPGRDLKAFPEILMPERLSPSKSKRTRRSATGSPSSPAAAPGEAALPQQQQASTGGASVAVAADGTVPADPQAQGNEVEKMTLSEFELQGRVVRDGIISLEDLKIAQNLDQKFSDVIESITQGSYKGRQYLIDNKILMRRSAEGKLKICLPESLLKLIFISQHCTDLGFHRTAGQIAMTLGIDYYAPNMLQKMRKFAGECHYCLISKPNTEPKHTIQSNLKALAPRQLWSFDICGGLTRTSRDNDKIHVFVCNFSLYTVLVASDSKSATSIIDSIKTHIIAPFTLPVAIRSDMERGLVHSNASQAFVDSHGIQLLPTAPGCPMSNGLVESRQKVIKGMIRAHATASHQSDWDTTLHLLAASLNQTVGRSGISPEVCMFGWRNAKANDVLQILPVPKDEEEYVKHVQENLRVIFATVNKQRDKAKLLNEKFVNAHRKRRSFEEGNIVMVQNDIITGESGMTSKFRGPYTILKISEHSETASLQELGVPDSVKPIKAHFSKMRKMQESSTLPRLNSNWDNELKKALPEVPERESTL